MNFADHYVIRHDDGRLVGPVNCGFELMPYPLGGGRWWRENAESLLPMLGSFNHDVEKLHVERAPGCGCCGRWHRSEIVVVAYDGSEPIIRCERHVGRNPCCIEGCGKTFAHKAGEDYHHIFMCGRHWRNGPKDLRDQVAAIRRKAKRIGWTDDLLEEHHRLWEEVRVAIVNGYDGDLQAEVDKLMGWA